MSSHFISVLPTVPSPASLGEDSSFEAETGDGVAWLGCGHSDLPPSYRCIGLSLLDPHIVAVLLAIQELIIHTHVYTWQWIKTRVVAGPPPLLQSFVVGHLLQTLVADLCVEYCSLQGACRGGGCRRTPPSVTNLCREMAAQACCKANVFDSMPYTYMYIVCLHVRMYVCMHVCMHVRMHVPIYVPSCKCLGLSTLWVLAGSAA